MNLPGFPAMLFKPGSMFEWDGEMFDYLVVDDEEEAEIALADGWVVGKPGTSDDSKPQRGRKKAE